MEDQVLVFLDKLSLASFGYPKFCFVLLSGKGHFSGLKDLQIHQLS